MDEEINDYSSEEEMLEDTDIEEEEEDSTSKVKYIDYTQNNYSIEYIVKRIVTEKDLKLDPYIQRNYVWDDKKKSKLIETIILGLPIPPIFVATNINEDGEKIDEVIDGRQRLQTILTFCRNEWKLTGKDLSKDIRSCSHDSLPKRCIKQIQQYPLNMITIVNRGDEKAKKTIRDMFLRINQGSVVLTPQELRNCMYSGKFINLLRELRDNKIYDELLKNSIFSSGNKKDRMEGEQSILRFFALYDLGIDRYKFSMKNFMDKYCEDNRNMSDEKLLEFRRLFCEVIRIIKEIFGDKPFIRLDIKSKRKNMFHDGVYDCVMLFVAKYYKKYPLIEYADAIREEYYSLFNNDEFKRCLTSDTTSNQSVEKMCGKMKILYDSMDKLFDSYDKLDTNRRFKDSIKQELLHKQKGVCNICKNRIKSIDLSEIDHDKPYWRGGQTIPKNAKLVHRTCNRKKGGWKQTEKGTAKMNFSKPIATKKEYF